MHRVVQQPLFGVLELGDIGERPNKAHHLPIRTDHRPRLDGEPEIMTVRRAQTKVLGQAPASLLQHAVKHGAEAVAVERMQHFQPTCGRALQRTPL